MGENRPLNQKGFLGQKWPEVNHPIKLQPSGKKTKNHCITINSPHSTTQVSKMNTFLHKVL